MLYYTLIEKAPKRLNGFKAATLMSMHKAERQHAALIEQWLELGCLPLPWWLPRFVQLWLLKRLVILTVELR